jgi:hypothetical protein
MKTILIYVLIVITVAGVFMLVTIPTTERNANTQFLEARILFPEANPQLKSNWAGLHYCDVQFDTPNGQAIMRCLDYKDALIRARQ